MIIKEFVFMETTDRFRKAGLEAEQQMAFYLKRAFGSNPDVHVFHGLRLERNGDAAQIDHLLLHRCGMVVVESKSVSGRVRVNERQEWSREYAGRWQGMPSPILQAQRQVAFLREILLEHVSELLGKAVLGTFQTYFRMFPIDVLVAISDNGVIESKGTLEHVCKADQVPDRLRTMLKDQRSLNSLLNFSRRSLDKGMTISREEFARVSNFLLAQHLEAAFLKMPPLQPEPQVQLPELPQPVHTISPSATVSRETMFHFGPFACKYCSSERLRVTYGKYGYYFKCDACQGNTALTLSHPTTGERLRVRKEGSRFIAESEKGGFSEIFFTNPV